MDYATPASSMSTDLVTDRFISPVQLINRHLAGCYNGRMHLIDAWRNSAERLKGEIYTLYLAYQDERTPWFARLFSLLVVGYALSPIDLIPDFIPLLGYLDDLILIPLGVYLAVHLIPAQVMADSRIQAREAIASKRPIMRGGAVIIVVIWILLAVLGVGLAYRWLRPWLNPASGG